MSAISALKGYRTQFLYSLHYILSNFNANEKFKLEGIEDLDILDQNDNVIKIIQVKNLTDPLVLSDIHSQSKSKTSFLYRYIETQKSYPKVKPIIISFGIIGPELSNWKTSDIAKKKRTQFKETDWITIRTNIELEKVDEEELLQQSLQLLKQKFSSIDPIPTIDFLLYWLSVIAEKQHIITTSDLVTKVEQIANYLSERIAITDQYGIYISALHLDDRKNEDIELLKAEFYRGVNARYAHIVHNIDTDRPDFIRKIKSGFASSTIVLLQGASGQGKSTLAYRYAHTYASSSLIYELNIQDNPEQSRLAILSIQSMVKSLEVPILFLINTVPNSTEWVKIVQEFSVYTNIHFLITIRQEDFYKAQATGLKFQYNEVELALSKAEAEDIYERINKKNVDLIHLDFEEAWIKFGQEGPLMEFIYTIVKGESLRNTLRAQVHVLEVEMNGDKDGLLTLLRLVAIADTYGARLSLEELKAFANLQSIIKRLDKEYLVKVSNDKKYISGLHPLRSKVLLESLFDDFVLTQKEFALDHILLIEDKDIYYFVLHLLHQKIVLPNDLLTRLESVNDLSWTYYYGIFKGLIWAGIDQYISNNIKLLEQAYLQFGDSWSILMDLYFGSTAHLAGSFEDFISQDFKVLAKEINSKMSDKSEVFSFVKLFLTNTPLPVSKPSNDEDWVSYGEMAFWLKEFNHDQNAIILTEQDYKKAFESLPVDILAIVMFGMSWQGETVLSYKSNYLHLFCEKLRLRFGIPELTMDKNTVTANYIVDLTSNDPEPKSLNERSVEILMLLRKALPEKEKYSAQGYGHRFLISSDDTTKEISAEHLPYEEWVEINSIIRKRYEYSILPSTWAEYSEQLYNWEANVMRLINEYIETFNAFYKGGLQANILVPLMNNSLYKNLVLVKPPQTISDPLGVYYDRLNPQLSNNDMSAAALRKLGGKYKGLFKSYTDFSPSIENFIRQSGLVVYHKIKQLHDPTHAIEDNQEHVSIRNIFDAAKNLNNYVLEKNKHLSKFVQKTDSIISDKQLIAAGYIWKQFLMNRSTLENKISSKAVGFIAKLKEDFEVRLSKSCKVKGQKGELTLSYINKTTTQNKPVLKVEVEKPYMLLQGIQDAFVAVKESLGDIDYGSLKYFMLEYYFNEIYILPVIQGKSLNYQWHKFQLYTFHTHELNTLEMHHWMASSINEEVRGQLDLIDWSEIVPKMADVKYFMSQFFRVSAINRHLVDLKELTEKDIDETGSQILTLHYEMKMTELQTDFQVVLDYLAELINKFPFDKERFHSDEMERLYWESFIIIKDNLFPTPKGEEENYEVKITMEIMESWKARLATCMGQIGFLYFFICGKMIQEVNEIDKPKLFKKI